MGVIQHTQSPVDPLIKMDMKNVRERVLFLSMSAIHYPFPGNFLS
jgi:hypothetical protein